MVDKKRVLVAMSGGVDSSVAAKVLVDAGYDCVGCTMRLYENEDAGLPSSKTCCSVTDVQDAHDVALSLDMPYHVFNFTADFRQKVIDEFCASYLAGRTPNPCIDCNMYMKFGKLFERAADLDCWYVATGHYVRVEERDGRFFLRKARDLSKDQSYVLYFLSQEQLAHLLFPLGDTCKAETRSIAADQGFINAEKPESMDICFVPDGDYSAIVQLHAGTMGQPGKFVNSDGQELGTHKGIACYTIGQRKGLGLYGPEPVYVNAIDPEANTITVGPRSQLFRSECLVGQMHWVAGAAPADEFRCAAKIRYRQTEQPCTVRVQQDGCVSLVFDEPQSAITPGQAAVLYDGEYVLGGGRIR